MTTLQFVFTSLAAIMIGSWFSVDFVRRTKIDANGIIAELRYGRILSITAMCFALTPPTLLCVLIWRLQWRDERMLMIAGSSMLCLGLVPGVLLIEVARVRVILTETSVIRISPWRATVTFAWNDIERVRYSALNRLYELRAGDRAIRVSRLLDGVHKFVESAKAKIPLERQGDLV